MLAIVGGKGGCGKTTTALGLATALTDGGTRAVAVDTDVEMPNLHVRAETDRTPGLEAIAAGAPPDSVTHSSDRFPDVEVIPAGRRTRTVSRETLARIRGLAGQSVLDCPAGASELVTTPIRAADAALVVATPARASRVDAAKTARMVETLGTPLLGAVLTRASHGRASIPSRGPLGRFCDVIATVPDIEGGPGGVLTDPTGRTAFARLAERISERNI
jgi:septum site-determining protein MinD